MKQNIMSYNAVFQEESEGGYSVWVPSLPGCASQGETFEEAKKNIAEAIELYLEDEPKSEEEAFNPQKQFIVPITITQS